MFSVLCAIRFPFLRMDVVNALPDLACQKTTGTEQLNCIYIHTKINKYTKKTLSFDALWLWKCAVLSMKAAGESEHQHQISFNLHWGDKWSVWAAIEPGRDGGGSLADMDTMNGWGLIWDVEDGGCVEDIKVIINHQGLPTNNDMSPCQARVLL